MPEESSLLLHGSLQLQDQSGQSIESPRGTLVAVGIDGGGEVLWEQDVPVVQGLLHAPVQDCVRVRFRSAVLESRGAAIQPSEISAEELGEVRLLATWTRGRLLRVSDRATGQELEQVTVVARRRWPENLLQHPGRLEATEAIARLRPSPLWVASDPSPDLDLRIHDVWVGGPGYAWVPVSLDCEAPGELVVDLERGASLEVTVHQGGQDDGVRVRMGGEGVPLAIIEGAAGRTVRLSGLVPGERTVSLETGPWTSEVLTLDSVQALLVAGSTTSLSLGGEAAPGVGSLSFRVIPRPGEELPIARLHIYPALGRGLGGRQVLVPKRKLRPDGEGGFLCEVGNLAAGTYCVEAHPIVHLERLEVVAGMEARGTLDLSSGVLVRWRVASPEGELLQPGRLDVSPMDDLGRSGRQPRRLSPGADGSFSSWVYSHGVRAQLPQDECLEIERSDVVADVSGALVLTTQRSCGVAIASNDVIVKDVLAAGGDGQWLSTSRTEAGTRINLSSPGSYTLDLASDEDQVVQRYQVTVGAGSYYELVLND